MGEIHWEILAVFLTIIGVFSLLGLGCWWYDNN